MKNAAIPVPTSQWQKKKYTVWLFAERETVRIDVQFDVDKIKNVDRSIFG